VGPLLDSEPGQEQTVWGSATKETIEEVAGKLPCSRFLVGLRRHYWCPESVIHLQFCGYGRFRGPTPSGWLREPAITRLGAWKYCAGSRTS
jgi:hypothetical protein